MTGSVVAGARLLASADDTVAVWSVTHERGVGAPVEGEDLVVQRVRFVDDATRERYFSADEPLPADLVLVRPVGAGELLAQSAVGSADDEAMLRVPLEVDPNRVPPDVRAGSVVDVWLTDGSGPRASRVGSGVAAGTGDPSGSSTSGPDGNGAGKAGTKADGSDAGDAVGPALSGVTVIAAPSSDDTFAVTGARQLVVAVDDERAAEFERLLGTLQDPVIRILQRS